VKSLSKRILMSAVEQFSEELNGWELERSLFWRFACKPSEREFEKFEMKNLSSEVDHKIFLDLDVEKSIKRRGVEWLIPRSWANHEAKWKDRPTEKAKMSEANEQEGERRKN
jgi:hypothetical protein